VDGGNPSVSNGTPLADRTAMFRARRRIRRRAGAIRRQVELRTDPTYRRLAAGFALPDGNRRVYCYHVRKTAGTSLFLSFLALGGEDPMEVWRRITAARLQRTTSAGYSYASNDRDVLAEGAYFFGRSHHGFVDQPLPPGTFTVTILRDPVERVRSFYDYLVSGDDPGVPGWVNRRQRLLVQDGFDVFLDGVPATGLLTQLAMFSEHLDVSEASDRIASCSSVFFTEDFAAGLAGLADRLGLPLVPYRARVSSGRTELTDGQRERLQARLEPEYELLRRLDEGGIASRGSTDSA
jgi:hypothetical protein